MTTIRDAYVAFAGAHPARRYGSRWVMSHATRDELRAELFIGAPHPMEAAHMLLGLPVSYAQVDGLHLIDPETCARERFGMVNVSTRDAERAIGRAAVERMLIEQADSHIAAQGGVRLNEWKVERADAWLETIDGDGIGWTTWEQDRAPDGSQWRLSCQGWRAP